MHAQYSETVDNGSYRDDGLSNGIPLQVHRQQHLEVQGTMRAQEDWNTFVSPITGYRGGLGDRFHFMSVTIPNCLPERLEIISYANEFAFLYDGMFKLQLDCDGLTHFSDDMEHLDLKQVWDKNSLFECIMSNLH